MLLKSSEDQNPQIFVLSGSINPEDEEKALTYSPVEGLVTKPLPAPTLRSILPDSSYQMM